jgi:hypothetical protein
VSELTAGILIALIGAVPPTIMAAAAYRKASKLAYPISQVNEAVNHRKENQKKLIEVVDEMANTMNIISDGMRRVEDDIQAHRAWHQKEEEYEITEEE